MGCLQDLPEPLLLNDAALFTRERRSGKWCRRSQRQTRDDVRGWCFSRRSCSYVFPREPIAAVPTSVMADDSYFLTSKHVKLCRERVRHKNTRAIGVSKYFTSVRNEADTRWLFAVESRSCKNKYFVVFLIAHTETRSQLKTCRYQVGVKYRHRSVY